MPSKGSDREGVTLGRRARPLNVHSPRFQRVAKRTMHTRASQRSSGTGLGLRSRSAIHSAIHPRNCVAFFAILHDDSRELRHRFATKNTGESTKHATQDTMVDNLNAKQMDQHDSIHDSTRYRPTIRGVDAQKVDYLQPCQRGEMIEYPFGHRRQAVTVH